MKTKKAPKAVEPRKKRQTQAERRAASEGRILDATIRTIGQKGTVLMTFADVGETAGYSRGLPAAIFGSKENLIVEAARRLTEFPSTRSLFAADPDNSIAEMIDMIEHWFEITKRGAEDVRGMHVLLSVGMIGETETRFPELYGVLQSIDDATRARFEVFLENGKVRGELRPDVDIKTEAILILGAVRGILWQWHVSPRKFDLLKVGRRFTQELRERLQPPSADALKS